MDLILATIFSVIVLIFSVVIHEIAHGAAANSLGDPTAKFAGRLTLNPLSHLDFFGSFVMPILLLWATGGVFAFGYAKPVPINPYNFRDRRFGEVKVAVAGVAANFALAIVFGIIFRILIGISFPSEILYQLIGYVVKINLMLAIFNLMPIPPLDGSHVLFAFLPPSQEDFKMFLQRYGFIFLVIFIFYFSGIISPIVDFLARLIIGGPL